MNNNNNVVPVTREFDIPIYNFKCVVSFDYVEMAERYPGLCEVLAETATELDHVDAVTWDGVEGDEWKLAVLFHPEFYNVNTLAHECLHLTLIVLETVGIPLKFKSQETIAYLLGWFVEAIDNIHKDMEAKIERSEKRDGERRVSTIEITAGQIGKGAGAEVDGSVSSKLNQPVCREDCSGGGEATKAIAEGMPPTESEN